MSWFSLSPNVEMPILPIRISLPDLAATFAIPLKASALSLLVGHCMFWSKAMNGKFPNNKQTNEQTNKHTNTCCDYLWWEGKYISINTQLLFGSSYADSLLAVGPWEHAHLINSLKKCIHELASMPSIATQHLPYFSRGIQQLALLYPLCNVYAAYIDVAIPSLLYYTYLRRCLRYEKYEHKCH